MNNIEGKCLIFYHREDNDGVFSGALIADYLINTMQCEKEDVVCVGLDYNLVKQYKRKDIKALREVYDHLFITDFSFPAKLMEYMYKLWGNNMVWCDHHKPIIEEVGRLKSFDSWDMHGERLTDRSAILCVWKWLYDPFDSDKLDSPENIPELLRILSGWDSFSYEREGFTLDYVRKVNYGITHIFNLNFVEVRNWLSNADKDDWKQMVKKAETVGAILVRDEDNRMTNIVKNSGDMNWKVIDKDGNERTACAIFIEGPSNSQMFASVADEVEHGIVFKRNANGNWGISLYNTKTDNKFHCGEFMKWKYKGGGHVGASGAQVRQGKFIKMLRTKTI